MGEGEPDAGAVAISETALVEKEFGFPLDQLYKKAVAYYKENEKEGHLVVSYDDRLKFMAYSKQVRLGPYQESHNDAGWFDITGNDRTKAWQSLGQLDREEAMAGFVFLLDRVCPPFKQFVLDSIEAPPTKTDESELRVLNGHGGDPQQPSSFSASAQQPPVDCRIYESQKKQIQEALNAQTYHQFRAYAQQQIQGAPEQQEALIKQLQEQHYQQYMAQVYAQHASQAHSQNMSEEGAGGVALPPNDPKRRSDEERNRDEDSDVSDEEPGDDLPSNPNIAPASLWNRQDISEFKEAIRKGGPEGIIKVGHGETVTIRVPTHEEGTSLFWEFATDHYDLGFGVLFEWTIADTNQVSVHVSESSDEEFEEEVPEGGYPQGVAPGDVESGTPRQIKQRDPNKPRQDEIIPVYRRDCHEEVYAGSHIYPGQGVYLLKFDNSYSLWRSKTLYYRVYYSK